MKANQVKASSLRVQILELLFLQIFEHSVTSSYSELNILARSLFRITLDRNYSSALRRNDLTF
jgi:hypothetical protein